MLIASRWYPDADNKMYYQPKINGNKTSIFIIIFTFIMIIPTTAIMLTITTNNPVYGQQNKTNFNAPDSSNT